MRDINLHCETTPFHDPIPTNVEVSWDGMRRMNDFLESHIHNRTVEFHTAEFIRTVLPHATLVNRDGSPFTDLRWER